LGNVLFGKESENPSEEKPVERPSEEKPVEKPSKEKPIEHPQPKPKPKLVRFHCDYGKERMAKEWANKDKYHPSNGVLEPRVQMPRAKAIVRTVLAWRDRKAAGSAAGRATLVRPVRHTGHTGVDLGRQGG
jgi:outer membrane biosynthesis protein TonB